MTEMENEIILTKDTSLNRGARVAIEVPDDESSSVHLVDTKDVIKSAAILYLSHDEPNGITMFLSRRGDEGLNPLNKQIAIEPEKETVIDLDAAKHLSLVLKVLSESESDVSVSLQVVKNDNVANDETHAQPVPVVA